MRLHELRITRSPSYASNPDILSGEVELVGESGKQTIKLSASSINGIMKVIRDQVEQQARENAAMTKRAINEAGQEALLLESNGAL